MAFVNESLTEEESKEFRARTIKNPGNPFMTLDPSKRTIDREKNVYLIWAMQEREEPDDNYFVFVWKNTPISVELIEKWVEKNTRKWIMMKIKIPTDLEQNRNEIINSLKAALTVYGFNGSPNEPFATMNKNTTVLFSF